MKLSKISLNFGPARGRSRLPVVWAAGVGALLLSAAAWNLTQALQGLSQERAASLDALQRERTQAHPAPRVHSTDPLVIARNLAAAQALASLQTPWNDLLTNLESLATPKVALLSVEPTPRKNSIHLMVEAATFDDMLDYVEAMQSKSGFSDVSLISHQVQLLQPGNPVRFQIQGTWKAHT